MSTIVATSARSPRAEAKARCEPRLAYDDENTDLVFLTRAFGLQEQTKCKARTTT
jgi:hypothetical protein